MNLKKLLFFCLCAALLLGLCACQLPDLPDLPDFPDPDASPTPGEGEAVVVEAEETSEPVLYTVRVDNCPYNSAGSSFPEPGQPGLAAGTVGTFVEKSGDFTRLALADSSLVWVHDWYLDAQDEAVQSQREAERLEAYRASPSFEPAESFLPSADHSVICMAGNGLSGRFLPDDSAPVLTSVPFGTELTVLGRDGDDYLCQMADGSCLYFASKSLSSDKTYVDLPGAVDLRVFLPSMEFEMLFASPNNITGEAMYPAIPLLEETTANMLAQALERFQNDGYTIKIYDAYRPKSAQFKLYDIVQSSWYIANPYLGRSWHQLGRAVDMSLVNMATGEELEMPTPMHTFAPDACRFNSGQWSETARQNVDYMTNVMTSFGFGTIETEWWHFENTGLGGYLDDNMDFSTLTYRPVSEYIQAHQGE